MKKTVIPIDDKDRNYSLYGIGINHFLFQLNYEFYLILYPRYMEGCSHLDMKEDFMKQVLDIKQPIGKFNISNLNIGRRYSLGEIKKDILSGVVFKDSVYEICHVYCNSANKEYCFAAKHSYLNYIERQCSYYNNYREAQKQIIDDQIIDGCIKDVLKRELEGIYLDNTSQLAYTRDYEQLNLMQLILKFSQKKKKHEQST